MAPPRPLHCTGAQGPSGAAGQPPQKSNGPSTLKWPMVLPELPLLTLSFAISALSLSTGLRSASPLVCSVRRHVRKMARQILRTPLAKRFVDSCALDIARPEDPPNPTNHWVFIWFSLGFQGVLIGFSWGFHRVFMGCPLQARKAMNLHLK